MHPHVAFRVPLRFLRAADQRVQLGKEFGDNAQIDRHSEPDGWLGGEEQQLLDLGPDPLGRQIVEQDPSAEGSRRLVECQREARGQLHCAEHAQAVVGKRCWIDHAQPPLREIVAAVERIQILTGEGIP